MYKVTLAPEKMMDALTLRALQKVLVDSYAREAGYARGSVRLIGVLKFHTHFCLFFGSEVRGVPRSESFGTHFDTWSLERAGKKQHFVQYSLTMVSPNET